MSDTFNSVVTPGATASGAAVISSGLQVYKLTTAVALAETIFPLLDSSLGSKTDAAWLNFLCDDGGGNGIPFYIMSNKLGGALVIPVPDPVANITAPLNITQQCIFVPAGIEWQRRFARDQGFRAIQTSGADAYLRVELVSLADE